MKIGIDPELFVSSLTGLGEGIDPDFLFHHFISQLLLKLAS